MENRTFKNLQNKINTKAVNFGVLCTYNLIFYLTTTQNALALPSSLSTIIYVVPAETPLTRLPSPIAMLVSCEYIVTLSQTSAGGGVI